VILEKFGLVKIGFDGKESQMVLGFEIFLTAKTEKKKKSKWFGFNGKNH